MALPAEFNTGQLTGHYVDLTGTAVSGQVVFTASPTVLIAGTSDTIVVPIEIIVVLDSDGKFSINLPATDDEDITPVDWTYTVREVFSGFTRTYPIQVPVGSTQDVSEINPIEVSTGTITTRGPRGRSVVDAIVNGSGHLILELDGTSDTEIDAGYVLGNAASETAFNGVSARIDAVESTLAGATPNATASALVKRDTNGKISVGTPTDAAHPARKDYVDPTITLVGAATDANTASTLVKRDSNGAASINQVTLNGDPSVANHAARKGYVDGLNTTMSGRVTTLETANSAATYSETPSTLAKRNSSGNIAVGTASNNGDALNLGTANGLYVPLTQKGAASGVAALDSGSRVQGTGLEITKAAAPASPATGKVRWYVSTDDTKAQMRIVDSDGLIRRSNMDWGSAGSLPAAANALRGDTAYHTGVGAMFIHNGTGWRLTEPVVVANAAARDAISTNYSALLYAGFEVQISGGYKFAWSGATWFKNDSLVALLYDTVVPASGTVTAGAGYVATHSWTLPAHDPGFVRYRFHGTWAAAANAANNLRIRYQPGSGGPYDVTGSHSRSHNNNNPNTPVSISCDGTIYSYGVETTVYLNMAAEGTNSFVVAGWLHIWQL